MDDHSILRETFVSFANISAALEALPAAFVVYDADDRVLICNEAYKQQYHPCEDFVKPGVSHEELQWLKVREGLDARAIGRAEAFVQDEILRHKTGPTIEEWRDDSGRYMRMMRTRLPDGLTVGMRFDITDLRETQLALEEQNQKLEDAHNRAHRQATIDELTGLTNRRAAKNQLLELTAKSRATGMSLAALHVDLDGFKQINDGLGHDAGDYVIAEVAKRLKNTVREDDLLARMGGDEFLIALLCKPNSTCAQDLAERIVTDLRRPFMYAQRPCLVGASVGIAIEQAEDLDPDRLLKSSDFALYKSKENGRNQCTYFDSELREQSEFRAMLAQELMSADLTEQIEAYFQPVVTADTHQLTSAEVLMRWRHPDLGIVSPADFLPVAEELKITAELDSLILQQVLAQRLAWIDRGFEVPTLAVNVSAQTLRDPHLLPSLRKLELPTNAISFELLETVFSLEDSDVLKWNIDGLNEMGIELQIDDYGTAHSSVSALLLVRPRRLKIDRGFIANLLESEESRDIVRLTVALAHALRIEVTAEGVETLDQANMLTSLQCDRLQGFHFGRPMKPDDFAHLLSRPEQADGAAVL